MKAHVAAIVIALIHLVLAVVYSVETPYRTPGQLMGQFDPQTRQHARVPDVGAPDERQHANYVQHLISGQGFPVFQANDFENYESHQSPAYYVLAAGFAKVVGVQDVAQQEGIRLRWLNALVGFGTVLGVYFLAYWGFQSRWIATGAAAFAGFLPMLCALDGAISNDPLLYFGLTWTVALLAKAMRDGWDWKLVIWIGLAAGLSLNTKTTALVAFPTLVFAAFIGKRPPVSMVFGAIAIAALLAAPWVRR